MTIIDELSSSLGDKTEQSNKLVAEKCIQNPTLLTKIAEALAHANKKIASDAAEVLTFVSAEHPKLVTGYVSQIATALDHKETKVRWEATHTLAQLATITPESIQGLLDTLQKLALSDNSKIVQDYATVTIGSYGGTSTEAAQRALPLLSRILEVEGDRQAVRVLEGMSRVLAADPALRDEIAQTAQLQATATKSSIKRVYTKLIKQLAQA